METGNQGEAVSALRRAAARWAFWPTLVVFVAATVALAAAERRLTTATLSPLQTALILAGYFTLPTAVVLAYRWMRHGTASYTPLVAGLVGGASAVVLAGGAYWHCSGTGTQVLTQIVWIGELFFGTASMPFGDVPGCPAQPPISLAIAQVMALGVLSLAAVKLVLKFSEGFVQRRKVRRARNLALIVGSSDRVAYADAIAADCEPDALTVSIGEDAIDHKVSVPQRAVLHLSGQLTNPDFFRSLLGRRREANLREIHLVDPDATTNLRWFDAVRDAVGDPPEGRAVRALVRIENPWAAEEWRRSALDTGGWIVDAISSYETTSYELLRQITNRKHDRIILCGSGALALAVCEVASQVRRELAGVTQALAEKDRPAPDGYVPEVTLLGPAARALSENHAVHQRRFGNAETSFDVVEAPVTREWVERVAGTAASPAIVFTEAEETLPIEVAARHEHWAIFAFDDGATGIAERALVGGCRTFGLALHHAEDEPVGEWERMARQVHEVYLATTTNLTRPTAKPWAKLSSFYRESNIRQVTNLIATVRSMGFSWGANEDGAPAGSGILTDSQILRLAEAEHTSWREYYEGHGWVRGPRDDANRRHPSLVSWNELDQIDRDITVTGVRASLVMLESFGYTPHVPWQPFERSGEVTAVRLEEELTWTTDDGQSLTGHAGDWLVTGPDGKQWTIGDHQLRETYRHVDGDVWRRSGEVSARPAVHGEAILTREGRLIASAGDWIVKDAEGNVWAVPADHFAANYRRAEPAGD
ncbi:MAG: hypothetical protein EOL89_00210 [Actinobacteria bacterium]|nr:hypothetical protein [Actinomycetota bacterium]